MSGFRASDNNQLLPYRHLSLLKEKGKLMADEKISAEEKTAKSAEIDAKMAEIERQMTAIAATK